MKKILSLLLILILTITAFASCKKKGNDDSAVQEESQETASVEGEAKIIEMPLSKPCNYYIGVKKSNSALLQQVNEFIAKSKADGTINKIIGNYYCENNAQVINSAGESAGGNQFVVATDARNPAFEEKESDGFSGIDIELAKALAEHLGKTLVIKDVNPDSFGTILEDGDADAVISCLTDSVELKEKMSFSEPYFSATQVLIVNATDNRFDGCENSEAAETIIRELPAGKKIGVQKYTLAQYYVIGDEDRNFPGFQAECVPYPSCRYAVENLLIGNVDCVITDESAAQTVLDSFQ